MASQWVQNDADQAKEAREDLGIWPLDEHNVKLLNEVHPRNFVTEMKDAPHAEYDLIAIGSGAGGLVSSKQTARRGGRSAMISEQLAGGDCLNVGCVPSKALIRSARAVSQIRKAASVGIDIKGDIVVDFPRIMERLRQRRSTIAPADGHPGTEATGCHVYQGRGKLTGANTLEVNGQTLKFKYCILAMGGRPMIPENIPGLKEAPYTTNERLFNLEELPPRMVILGAGMFVYLYICLYVWLSDYFHRDINDACVMSDSNVAADSLCFFLLLFFLPSCELFFVPFYEPNNQPTKRSHRLGNGPSIFFIGNQGYGRESFFAAVRIQGG
jgi:hypothetical protein